MRRLFELNWSENNRNPRDFRQDHDGMSLTALLDVIQTPQQEKWTEINEAAFASLFGSPNGRYPKTAEKTVTLRAPKMSGESNVPFAAFIHPSNPTSGAYSGFSFVIFPVPDASCLIGLVVGTGGLSPDETILGRPGHARKAQAICTWLNREFGEGELLAWAKQDPTRTDLAIPDTIRHAWSEYKNVFDKYGKEVYAVFHPNGNQAATEAALTAFLDLMFEERGHRPIGPCLDSYEKIRGSWFEHLMPGVGSEQVSDLLDRKHYVIIQGPPGTGKTRMATELLRDKYAGRGRSIQFHPSTTYETFIGGLAPVATGGDLGLRFEPTPGALMIAAAQALADPEHSYLLHVDEINRADLGKVLGEAIFLLESKDGADRRIELPYDFGVPFHREFYLPSNLHILGTMNSADRSIAIVDVAVRRRFSFVSLWPRMSVVEQLGSDAMQAAFRELTSIFVEHATDEAFSLVPGHSYYLESEQEKAGESLSVSLAPLLDEYLAQGYVAGFGEPIRAFLQKIRSL